MEFIILGDCHYIIIPVYRYDDIFILRYQPQRGGQQAKKREKHHSNQTEVIYMTPVDTRDFNHDRQIEKRLGFPDFTLTK